MKVIYYYYYLFYKKILKDNEPHMLATLALGFSLSLIFNGVLAVIILKCNGQKISKYLMIGTLIIVLALLYFILHNNGFAKEIVKEKPSFYNSKNVSIIITLIFFILSTSIMFWMPSYIRGF